MFIILFSIIISRVKPPQLDSTFLSFATNSQRSFMYTFYWCMKRYIYVNQTANMYLEDVFNNKLCKYFSSKCMPFDFSFFNVMRRHVMLTSIENKINIFLLKKNLFYRPSFMKMNMQIARNTCCQQFNRYIQQRITKKSCRSAKHDRS